MSLKVIFAGTPEFARLALEAIHGAGFELPLVLTQPDRPAGRGMQLAASPVKQFAAAQGIPVLQPPSLKRAGRWPEEAAAALETLRNTPHDVMVVAAYGLILPQEVLDIAPHGCLNIHASLLPRWRGAAPIQRALEAGDAQTGVTIMQMDAGLDTGGMISLEELPITGADTGASLHDKLAALGARMIVEALRRLETEGRLAATPQPEEGACYAAKLSKEEAALDFTRDAQTLARRIRAFNPVPGSHAQLREGAQALQIKFWLAEAAAGASKEAPGTILEANGDGVLIACGEGEASSILRVTELQKPGGKRLPARQFLAGCPLARGERFVTKMF
ncbi:MAG: methionyl-tRNA formyltransferase [Candidatus Protistobacter heckmanni]|nr:methionyl-tRNA formyltransferase [Candidatus Protistobacter heckmanni]